MRKRMKTILAVMLAASMTVGAVPAVALAEDAQTTQETSTSSGLNPAAAAQERADSFLKAAKMLGQTSAISQQSAEESQEAQTARKALEARSVDYEAVKGDIEDNIFLEPEATAMDLSEYGLKAEEAEAITEQVLTENSADTLVETEVIAGADGQADVLTISRDPVLKAASEEVNELADGEGGDGSQEGNVPMTDEQKKQILDAYAQYQAFIDSQPEIFGVQTPFYSQKESESTEEKWYGPLGSLLVTAGIPDVAFEMGQVDFETLYGTVMMFQLGNAKAAEYYGQDLAAAIQEGVSQIKDGMTTVQKLLVLNDWLAEWSQFDMGMLMGMAAPEQGESWVPADDPDIPAEMAGNIEGLWKGNQFGPLVMKNGVCLGYSNAYTLLVQNAFPEIYKNEDGSWKTKQQLNYIQTEETQAVDAEGNPVEDENGDPVTVAEKEWSPDAPYMVDYVRITYDASVTMFGEEQDKFDSDHYWNAVKVDGKWYYVDPCYTDIYIECMMRDRVETDGNMNHLYFMVSDSTIRKLYDGNYSNIDTLYQNIATDTTYESSWLPFIKSPVDVVDGKYYYFYDSTDMVSMLGQFGGMNGVSTQAEDGNSGWGDWQEDTDYQLVYHDGSEADTSKTFTTLVDFVEGTVLVDGQMVANDLIKDLYAKHQAYQEKYPSIQISGSVYNGLFYFNIANTVCTYNLETGEVKQILEYNEVSAKRDMTVALGGLGFNVVPNDSEDKDITLYDKPIASMTIKNDGNMYVSVATNLGWISGKTGMDDQENLGYAFEETNYTPGYNSYFNYNNEVNDNDEFMWSANFVDVKSMSELTGTSHNYTDVTVAPSCETEGYTESRCADCGLIEGTERTNATEALGHHYLPVEEQYYTKDESGNWNTGSTNVCPRCLAAKDELEEGDPTGHTYGAVEPTYSWSEDHATCQATFQCDVCPTALVDCVYGQDIPTKVVSAEIEKTYAEGFDCSKGGDVTYTAKVSEGGHEWTNSETVTLPAGTHVEKYTYNNDGTHSAVCEVCGTVIVENEVCTYDENGICTKCGSKDVSVTYMSHVQTYGDRPWVSDGESSGTENESKRMESIYIKLENATAEDSIQYKAHVQGIGWQDWVEDGEMAGTQLQSKRVEAIQIKLDGPIADKYDVYYRVHAQQFGWLDWAKNGEEAGTAGYGYRLEAFQVKLVKKDAEAPGDTENPFEEKLIEYSVHVQNYGDQGFAYDGMTAGTVGESKRLEQIRINLPTNDGKSSIKYKTHVQTYGWEDAWSADGQRSGTQGESKRLEAIQIKLEGDMAEKYDVYYCVHAQQFGWLGWAKNGESAGTAGYSYRLEGIKIMLVEKGADAPAPVGSETSAFKEK